MAGETSELPRNTWGAYFDELSRGLATVRASVEVEGPEIGAQVEEEGLELNGITYDHGDDILVVGLSPGGAAETLEHIVSSPRRIEVVSGEDLLPATIDVQDGEGNRTLLRLSTAPALPAE
jgi:hypothetical protein